MAPKGEPIRATPRLPDKDLRKVVPYGIYDLGADTAGSTSAPTTTPAAFAVQSLRRWWNGQGRSLYARTPTAAHADAGGSNGYRTRAWKSDSPRSP